MENEKSFFKRIHTDRFKWYDEVLIIFLIAFFFMEIVGGIVSAAVTKPLDGLIISDPTGYWEIFAMYFSFTGIWIVFILFLALVKRNRPILKAIWTAPKGNNLKFLGIGLLIGLGMNMVCAIGAMLHKDIAIYFNSFDFIKLLLLFIVVFIQSSAEELVCRGFIYQSLRRGYRHPAVAIVGNALFFGIMHLLNPGVTPLAIMNIVVVGILFSMMVYYMDSIWCAFGVHTAWNFTQNLLLGLPNSGHVSPFSVFKLDAASATNSFAYDVGFGVEGTYFAIAVQLIGALVIFLLFRNKKERDYDIWNLAQQDNDSITEKTDL